MPKLAKKAQKKVKDAEIPANGFEPLPIGKYIATLAGVEDKIAQSSGAAMWGVEMEDIQDLEGNEQPGRQFTNLVLAGEDDEIPEDWEPRSLRKGQTREDAWANRNAFLNGKVKEFFEAFGYSVDSDTDEMVGERCVIKVSQQTITGGKRKGELGNQIDAFFPLDSVDHEASGDADDNF